MAGNVNTAPTAFWRMATRFRALFIGPRPNTESGATARDMTRVKIQASAAQTANILEVLDSSSNVLASIDAAGMVKSPTLNYATVTISAADIVATGAGKFGHAAGVPLVADPGAGKLVELVSAIVSTTFGVAAYTAGGNITININGGIALTGVLAAAASLGAGASNAQQLVPLAATCLAVTANKGLNVVAATAFTNPGTATGTVKVLVAYRVHTL